jgi:hypothetical protein
VDAVAVEVASGAVVVLGGPGVGLPDEELGVPARDAGVEPVRGLSQGVRTDVPRDAGGLRDPQHHAVGVAAVNRLAGGRSQDQPSFGPVDTAGVEDPTLNLRPRSDTLDTTR